MTAALLAVRGLGVDFFVDGRWLPAAVDVSYDVHPGEVVAVVGESGSGKTQAALALVGLLPPNGRVTGSASLDGRELVGLSEPELSRVRGKEVGIVFQDPTAALNPVHTIGSQVVEVVRAHTDLDPAGAHARVLELLGTVGLPDPAQIADRYPHELSGGQRQRAVIAQALAGGPRLLVADEPTTALDVTVQAEILDLLRDLGRRLGVGILLITHDMGVVADLADRVVVLQDGRVLESGTADDVFTRPASPWTRELLTAVPRLRDRGAEPPGPRGPEGAGRHGGGTGRPAPLLAEGLVVDYPARRRADAVRAVDGVDLTIDPGEVVALVGGTGSGKTTVGRAVVGLVPVGQGSLRLVGSELAGISRRELRRVRRRVSMVFQDPVSSLDPRLTVAASVAEPLAVVGELRGAELRRRVDALLDQVHLAPSLGRRHPHELSGGQRQRVAIARALATGPSLLVADEPTSALDVSVQHRVLALLQELQREHGFACLLISHDLAVVEMMAGRIAVMEHGRVVEHGTSDQVLGAPRHECTQRLLAAVPVADPARQRVRRAARARGPLA